MQRHGAGATVAQARSVYQQQGQPDRAATYYKFPFTPQVLTATNLWPPCSVTHVNLGQPIWDPHVPLLTDLDAYQRLHYEHEVPFASVPEVTSEYHRSLDRPALTNVAPQAFKNAYLQIWPRWSPYWEDGPDAGIIRALQREAMRFQEGETVELAEGDMIDVYERFVTRLYRTYCEHAGLEPFAVSGTLSSLA
jgi:hypothetical protein